MPGEQSRQGVLVAVGDGMDEMGVAGDLLGMVHVAVGGRPAGAPVLDALPAPGVAGRHDD
ncbi:hypothetical protein ACFVZW_19785 [Streptomyces sp. NPDC059567]|uniref:hypothetical protein n=1 Tax=Streptomyces sp. NPDC059567 TaxID=3346867 RepID=UPI0036C33910